MRPFIRLLLLFLCLGAVACGSTAILTATLTAHPSPLPTPAPTDSYFVVLRVEPVIVGDLGDRVTGLATVFVEAPGATSVEVYVQPLDAPYGKPLSAPMLIGADTDSSDGFAVYWPADEPYDTVQLIAIAYSQPDVNYARSSLPYPILLDWLHASQTATAQSPIPDPQSASIPDARDLFPYFAYVTAGGWADIEIAAEAWGIPPEEYMDAVCADLAAHGFNVVWLNNVDYAILSDWLAAAERHGLLVIAQGAGPASIAPYWDNSQWPYPDGWREVIENEVKPFWQEQAPLYRDNPTLLAHVLVEEIPPEPELYDVIAEVTAAASQADPTHPFIVEYNNVDSIRLAAERLGPPVIVWGEGPFPADGSTDDDTRYFFPVFREQSYQAARSIDAPLWVLTQGNDFDTYYNGVFQQQSARRPLRAPFAPPSRQAQHGLLNVEWQAIGFCSTGGKRR